VYEQPGKPCHEPGDMNLPKLRNCRGSADRRQAAFVPVMKSRPGICGPILSAMRFDLLTNHLRHEAALLDGDRGHPGQQVSVFVLQRGEIANDKYFRMSRQAQVRLDRDASCAVNRNSKFLAERRSSNSGGPQHHRGGKLRLAYVNRSGFDSRDRRRSPNFYSEIMKLLLSAAGKIFGIRCQHARTALNQQNVRLRRIDGPKFVRESVTADFGQCPGQFDSSRPAAHYDKVHRRCRFSGRSLTLGQFKCQKHTPPDLQRVFNCLQAGCKLLPRIVPEIRMTRAGGDDKVVVGIILAGSLNHPAVEIESRHLTQQDFDILLVAKNRPDWCRNFPWREPRRSHLVKQRLKSVVILAVDERDLDRSLRQFLRRVEAAEAGAHDYHPSCFLAVRHLTSIRFTAMPEGSISSTEALTSRWLRWLMPSVADLIFVALLAVLVFTPLSVRLLGDAGIGWHIRTGQQILTTHAIPHVDPFSSTMQGKPWFAWEWLYDMVVGELESALGLNGVVWLNAIVIAGTFASCFRLLLRRGTDLFVALVLVLVSVSASMIHFLARPHVVSWLLTLAWFAILDASEREGAKRRALLALPLLMVVWANVHGGFLIGFALLAIFWLGAVWSWFSANESRIEEALQKLTARRRALDLAGVALLSAAASLLNPYGWNLHRHVYSYLSNRFLMDHIQEFQSPDFHRIAQKCFLALLLIALAALAARGRELRLCGVLTVLFAAYTGLYASRNIPISSLLLAIVMGPLAGVPFARGFSRRMAALESSLRGQVWPLAAVVFTFLIAARGHGSNSLMSAHFDPSRMPVRAVDGFERGGIRGPVLAPDYWGGYLIYRMYPSAKVVVDDRHDLYGEEFFKSYLKMVRLEPGWEQFLNDHPASFVLLPKDAALTSMLSVSPNWKQFYSDDVAIVFEKK